MLGDRLAEGLALGEAEELELGEILELGDTLALKLFDMLLLMLGDREGLIIFTLSCQSASIFSDHVRFKLPSLSSS